MRKTFILNILLILIIILMNSCNNKKCPSNEEETNVIFTLSDSSKRAYSGEDYSRKLLEIFFNDTTANLLHNKILINNEQTLIKIAEPILFNIYGKENIINERPYEIYLIGDNWIMNGTLPRNTLGGTFSIAINQKTSKVIGITHGK